jgi:hypothetical protein
VGDDLADAFFAVAEKFQDFYSGGVGEGVEDFGFEFVWLVLVGWHKEKMQYNNI